MCESCRKLDLRFLLYKTETYLVSVTYLILRFPVAQNKFQQTNKNEINHINDNHINFEVSLHFLGIWPTVRQEEGIYLPFSPFALFASLLDQKRSHED